VSVIGYTRVSTADQEHGIDAQRASILAESVRRGWEVVWLEDEGKSGKDIDRPSIRESLSILKAGEATALVVSSSTGLADRCRTSLVCWSCRARRAGASWH
jgi:DNA invertase Pin-like site-specific DNA recombinase